MVFNATMYGHEALHEFHWDVFVGHMPIIVVLSVFAVIGLLGNVVTLIYYCVKGMKNTVNFLIACLAGVDFLVCVMLVLGIVEIGYNVTFSSRILCKTLYLFMYALVFISILFLSLISIDRYRKVCMPFKPQMTLSFAKRGVVILTVVAFTCSSRAFITYDSVSHILFDASSNTTYYAYQCEDTKDPKFAVVVEFFQYFDIVMVGSILLVFILTYSLIIRSLYLHIQLMKEVGKEFKLSRVFRGTKKTSIQHLNGDCALTNFNNLANGSVKRSTEEFSAVQEGSGPGAKQEIYAITKSTDNLREFPVVKDSQVDGNSEITNRTTEQNGNETNITNNKDDITANHKRETNDIDDRNGTNKRNNKREAKSATNQNDRVVVLKKMEVNTTLMMIVVTLWFLLTFSLYFVSITRPWVLPVSSMSYFMQKCSFLNSVMNPIIYLVFNRDLRKFVMTLCGRCRIRTPENSSSS